MNRPIIGARYSTTDGEQVEVYAVSGDYVGVLSTRKNESTQKERNYSQDEFDRFFTLNDPMYASSEAGTEI